MRKWSEEWKTFEIKIGQRFAITEKEEGPALTVPTCCPACTVDVGGMGLWQVIVDYVVNLWHVKASAGKVGGDKDVG